MNATLNKKMELSQKQRFTTMEVTARSQVLETDVSNAIKHYFDIEFELAFYEEHSLTKGSSSRAVAYVGVVSNKKRYWGVGVDADIIKASIEALVVAVNKLDSVQRSQTCKDERLLDITNYIYANYKEVTLDALAEKFFLSKLY